MINLTVVIESDEAIRKFRELQNVAKTTTSSVVSDAERMDNAFDKLKGTLIGLGAGLSLVGLVKQIANVRGEFQKLEVAFTTLLGSKEKADKLMGELVQTAATTPFDLQGVANGARQLLAYGTSADQVNETLVRLGNIAAGLSMPLNDLVYLYGTTMVQGRLFTQDVRQFTGRGIPLVKELAAMYGKTTEEINAMVTAGKIGFEDVKKVIDKMTDSGGQFYNLMEEQSKTISGLMSNLEDAFDTMFNDIGKSTQGVIAGALEGAISLVENYDKILKILGPLVLAYGAYKAALIAVAAAQRVVVLVETIQRFIGLARAVNTAAQAMRLLNVATKANPIGLLVSAISAVVGYLWAFSESAEDAANAIGQVEQALKDEQAEVNNLTRKLTDANTKESERKTILERLREIAPSVVKDIEDEKSALDSVTESLKVYNVESAKRQVLGKYQDKLNDATQKHNEALTAQVSAENELVKVIDDLVIKFNKATKVSKLNDHQYSLGFHIFNDQTEEQIDALKSKVNSIYTDTTKTAKEKAEEIAKIFILEDEDQLFSYLKVDGINFSNLKTALKETKKANEEYTTSLSVVSAAQKDVETNAKSLGLELNSLETNVNNNADANTKPLSLKKKIEETRNELKILEKELKDLQSGIIPEDKKDDPNFDWNKAIKDKKEERDEKQKVLNTLLGTDSKDIKKAETKYQEAQKKYNKFYIEQQKKLYEENVDLKRNEIKDKAKLIEYDLNVALAAIQKEKEEYLKLIEAYNNLAKAKGQPTVTADTQVFTDRENIVKAKSAQQEQEYLKELLREYETYEEQRLRITEEYDKKIAFLKEKGESDNAAVAAKVRDKALADLAIKYDKTYQKIFRDTSRMTRKQIGEALKRAKDALLKTENIEEIKLLSEQINNLQDASDNYFSTVETGWANVANLYKNYKDLAVNRENIEDAIIENMDKGDYDAAEELEGQLENIDAAKTKFTESLAVTSAMALANGLKSAGDEMQRLAEISGDERLAKVGELFSNIGNTLGSVMSGLMSGGAVGAIIGFAQSAITSITGLFTKLAQSAAEATQYNKSLKQEAEDYERELTLLKLRVSEDDYDSIFGVKSLAKVVDAYGKAKQALEEYRKVINEPFDLTEQDVEDYLSNLQVGALESAKLAKEKGYNKLQGIQIKTKDYNAWQEFWGKQDQYQSLADYEGAKEVFNEDGSLNVENAKAFLETTTKLTEEQRKQIQNAIDLEESYEEAMEVLEDVASNILGDIAGDISDAIFDSIENGTDAWDNFEVSAAGVIKRLGEMMIQEWAITNILDKYGDSFIKMLGDGNKEGLIELVGNMVGDIQDALPYLKEVIKQFYNTAEENGIDMSALNGSSVNTQTTASRGFETMNQDTASELNGRFTAIQGSVNVLMAGQTSLIDLSRQQVVLQSNIFDTTTRLAFDTSLIRQYTKKLPDIDSTLSAINRKLDNI